VIDVAHNLHVTSVSVAEGIRSLEAVLTTLAMMLGYFSPCEVM
jgi:hypothetical protein